MPLAKKPQGKLMVVSVTFENAFLLNFELYYYLSYTCIYNTKCLLQRNICRKDETSNHALYQINLKIHCYFYYSIKEKNITN